MLQRKALLKRLMSIPTENYCWQGNALRGLCVFCYIIVTTLENRNVFLLLLQNVISENGSISKIAPSHHGHIMLFYFPHRAFFFPLFFFPLLIFYASLSPFSELKTVAATEKELNELLAKAT